jgi:uncharacterized protein (TIRG00374 family)
MAKLLIKLLISCLLLGVLLWRVPLGAIGAHLRSFEPLTLVWVLTLALVCWVIAAARLWCLLPSFRFLELLNATFIAKYYATVLPGQIAGDVVKAYRLGRKSGWAGHAEAATALDRGLGLFALFVVSAIASATTPRLPLPLRLFFIFGSVGIAVGGLLVGSPLFRKVLAARAFSRLRGRVGNFIRAFTIALHEHMHRPIGLLAALVPAVLFHVCCVMMQVLLGNDLGIKLGWADWIIVYAGVSLITLLPISVAGLGLREGGYVGMLALFGYKASVALSLSFAMLVTALVAALVGGALELATAVGRSRMSHGSARESNGRR